MTDYNNNERRYALKVYHRSAEKPDCPSCGRKHRFSEYIDLRTGKPVGPGCGKCDRENNCRYRVTPSEYFRQRPEAKYGYLTQATPVFRPEPKPRLYLPEDAMQRYSTPYTQSNFGRWIESIAPSREALDRTVQMYHLTATLTQGIIFWYIDHTSHVCQGKMMWYTADGHRNGYVYNVSSDMAKHGLMPEECEMQRCLFGAHLLKDRPNDTVFIVESEKTAVVMSMLQPQHIWLATGGCSMLNTYVVRPLFDRHVVLVPDSGCLDKWRRIMEQTASIHYSFVEDLEKYPPNTDLLDII